MYMFVRTCTGASALADKMVERQKEVSDLLSSVAGFKAYYATRSGNTLTTVTVCESKAGTDKSTRNAGEWAKANIAGSGVGAPAIVEGEAFLHL